MKKILFVAGIFISGIAMAQTEKNTWLVGGGLALRTGEGNSQFTFNPNAGAFVANNFLLGGNLNFDFRKQGNVKVSSFGIGPIARYYFGKATTRPFVVTEYNFQTITTENTTNNTSIKTNGSSFLFGLGFAAFVNENVAIEGVSGYSYSKFEDTEGSSGFVLRLGFGLYFNRRNVNELKTNMLN